MCVQRNDQITTSLIAENFPNETKIEATFHPKTTRNIKGILCNLSLVSWGVFITNQGQKAERHKVKVEWMSRLHYTLVHEVGRALNSEMNTEKKSLSNAEKMGGRNDQEKERGRQKARQT